MKTATHILAGCGFQFHRAEVPMLPCLAMLMMAALPSPEELLEQVRAQRNKIDTFECQFFIKEEMRYSADQLKRVNRPGPWYVLSHYHGVHRFAAPDRYYTEWVPTDATGKPLSAAKSWVTGGAGHQHAALSRFENGSHEATILPYAVVGPSSSKFFLPEYFRMNTSPLKAADQNSVHEKDGYQVLKCISANGEALREYLFDPRRQLSLVGQSQQTIYPQMSATPFRHPVTYATAQVPTGEWVCTGGTHRQVNPDGMVAVDFSIEIPLGSIRVNEKLPDSDFVLPIANGTQVFDQQTKKSYTVGTRAGPDDAMQRQLAEQLGAVPSLASEALMHFLRDGSGDGIGWEWVDLC